MEDDVALAPYRFQFGINLCDERVQLPHHVCSVRLISGCVFWISRHQRFLNLVNDGLGIRRVQPDMWIEAVMPVIVMPVIVMVVMVIMLVMPVIVMLVMVIVIVMLVMPVIVMVIMLVMIVVIVMIIMVTMIMCVKGTALAELYFGQAMRIRQGDCLRIRRQSLNGFLEEGLKVMTNPENKIGVLKLGCL